MVSLINGIVLLFLLAWFIAGKIYTFWFYLFEKNNLNIFLRKRLGVFKLLESRLWTKCLVKFNFNLLWQNYLFVLFLDNNSFIHFGRSLLYSGNTYLLLHVLMWGCICWVCSKEINYLKIKNFASLCWLRH